ncbi:hypothetical protein [Povalibacter sp.]|uniref:hypothetical protein n=1 Tax=Povalibacter sp. TaxID=1962978 RepID=UPI002D1FB48A|nr:hypothetical protein [Povalibacter sp.]
MASLCERFNQVGTSAFVEAEFNALIFGFMKAVVTALARLPNRDREQAFSEIWNEVLDLLPAYYPGKSLTQRFSHALADRFRETPVSPRYIENTLQAQMRLLKGRFGVIGRRNMRSLGTVFDRTSCCLWQSSTSSRCEREDVEGECRLHGNCWRERSACEAAVQCLAQAPVEEKEILSKRLPQLMSATDPFEFLKIITHHPNAFGDVLIFSEVPERWSLLTKDYSFFRLHKELDRPVEVLKVRLPRTRVQQHCQVRIGKESSPMIVEGMIENASPRDLGVRTTQPLGRKNAPVAVHHDGRWCIGRIARIEDPAADGSRMYGIRVTRYE